MNNATEIRNPLRKAFTLIELLVVIAIIVVLVAVSIPALKILGQSNGQKQAVNLLTSLIANARATAIQSHTQAGLVVFEDPSSVAGSSAQLIIESSTASGGVTNFVRVPRTVAQRFPIGVLIASMDNATGANTLFKAGQNVSGTINGRVILFDENGQVVMHNSLTLDSSLNTDAAALAWKMNGSGAVSSPGFIVYDATEAQAAKDTGKASTDAALGQWIEQHADVIVINPYTGNVIR